MSRFFHGGSSDSETETSSDDYSSTDSEEQEQIQAAPSGPQRFSRFLKDSDDSDEEGGKRVVRSALDKSQEELRSIVKAIDLACDSEDWIGTQTQYEKLVKHLAKSHTLIKRHGYPAFLLECLVKLEDELTAVHENKELKKKLDAQNAKALTALRQNLRKQTKALEGEIKAWRAQNGELETDVTDTESIVETGGKKKASVSFAVPAAAAKTTEITAENLFEKLREIHETRGKKGTDRGEAIKLIEHLLTIANSPIQLAHVLMALISAKYDFNQNILSCQSLEMWKSTECNISQLFEIIENHPDIVITESGADLDEYMENRDVAVKNIRGNIVSLISRLDSEFSKSLQSTDPHTTEYVDRLKDEVALYCLILRAENYLTKQNDKDSLMMLRILKLEHIYYKYNSVILTIESTVRQKLPSLGPAPPDADVLVHDISVFLYENAQDRIRTRAILLHVYHHALHKRYTQARDLLLMSHLQETISKADIPTQVLFNRALAQIGICAFRCGLIKECHAVLTELLAALKTKDILAQGNQLSKHQNTVEVDKKEKQRILPFHMHINLELLEAIQLIVSMLIELPMMALNTHDSRRRMISRNFRRILDFSERQLFTGPPESFRDSIIHASKAFNEGDWKRCLDLVTSIKIWEIVPDSESVKESLTNNIKQEGLRTYLLNFGYFCNHISLDSLASMFDISIDVVLSTVCRMILYEELHGSVDGTKKMIQIYDVQPTKLEHLSSAFCDKGYSVADFNDKFAEALNPPKDDRKGGQRQGGSYQRGDKQKKSSFA